MKQTGKSAYARYPPLCCILSPSRALESFINMLLGIKYLEQVVFWCLQTVSPDDKYEVRASPQDAAVSVTNNSDPKVTVWVTLTSPVVRDGEASNGRGLPLSANLGTLAWLLHIAPCALFRKRVARSVPSKDAFSGDSQSGLEWAIVYICCRAFAVII